MQGNPINSSTGNKFQDETDYRGVGAYPLSVHRYYNSLGDGTGMLGNRWGLTYQRSVIYQNSSSVQLIRDDGEYLFFSSCGSAWCAVADETGTLTEQTSGSTIIGWTFVDANDVTETYNATGQLTSETNRGGISHSLSYDGSGRLSTVTDSFGLQLSFSYDSSSRIYQITEPGGGVVTYAYDSSNNLNTVTYPDSSVRTYLYDESADVASGANPYMLTGIQDESSNRFATFTYDSQSRAISSQHAGGADLLSLTYNSDLTTTAVDALGASRTYTFTTILDVNHVASVSGSGCSSCGLSASYTLNSAGDVTSKTDFNGNETDYSIDSRHLEESRTEATGNASARTTTTSWSSSFRVPSSISVYAGSTATGTPLRTTSLTYDSSGNQLTKTITEPATSTSRTWTFTYDSYGHVLTVDGPRTDVSDVTTYTYYSCTTGSQCGQVHTVTDAAGNETVYNTYNANGQPLTLTDPNGTVTTLTYDTRQRLTSRQIGSETTSFAYYPTGLLETVTLPDSSTVTYSYDNAHRLTGISDSAGNSIAYTLDAMGNRTAEKSYDPSSTLHRTHSRVFNSLNELYQDINAAGTSAVTTSYGYDSNGNQTAVNAPLSRSTANAYDALNRLSQITDPASGVTQFAYDANDNLTQVTDPRSLATSYTYNGFGDVTQRVSPDTGTTSNTYDSGGNLNVSTDARSDTANYSYDALNRVSSIVYKNGSGVTDQTLSFGYDTGTNGKGRLVSAADGNQSLSWAYDGHGRVTGKGQTIGTLTLSVGYAYTNADLTAISTPSGQAVTYTYNSNHQVTTVKVNGTTVLSGITYEPFDAVNGWSWGSGDTVARTYNGDGLISQIVSASVTNGYSFDNADRITGISDSSNSALTWSYGYDVLDRLTSGSTSAITDGWTYDASGNRLSQTGTNATTFNISSGSNQLSSTSGSLVRTYANNAAGMTTAYGSDVFSYNDRGRMMGVTVGSTTTSYLYNALGQLIEKTTGSNSTVVIYDESGHILGEYDGSGNLIEETVWLGDIPVATLQPSGSSVAISYVHTNHLNAPTKVTRSSDNALEWRIDQDPFGTASANQNPGGLGTFVYNPRFPGQLYMSETSLNYNYFRDYDPNVGRYIESDPIGLYGGINTYAYARSNALGSADPSGLNTIAIGAGIGSAIEPGVGTAIGAGIGAIIGVIAVHEICKKDDNFCHDRWEKEDARCSQWSNLGGRVVAACKTRAADRRNLCVGNGGKPNPEEPPEYNPFRDYPR